MRNQRHLRVINIPDENFVMTTGKYVGIHFGWILKHDLDYAVWLMQECSNIKFSKELKEKIRQLSYLAQ